MLGFQTTKGKVIVETGYLAQLASHTASECFGVVGLSGAGYAEIADMVFGKGKKKGVEITIEDDMVDVKLYISVTYGVNISAVVKSIMKEVRYAIEEQTGFPVKNVDVYVRNMG